jgi:hypothetical protein
VHCGNRPFEYSTFALWSSRDMALCASHARLRRLRKHHPSLRPFRLNGRCTYSNLPSSPIIFHCRCHLAIAYRTHYALQHGPRTSKFLTSRHFPSARLPPSSPSAFGNARTRRPCSLKVTTSPLRPRHGTRHFSTTKMASTGKSRKVSKVFDTDTVLDTAWLPRNERVVVKRCFRDE